MRVAHTTVMPQLFVTMDELSSEACWSIVFMHPGGYAVLYRPGIDGDGVEIPDTRHIAYWCSRHAGDCGAREGHIWYKVVPFGEIETEPSDPKHFG